MVESDQGSPVHPAEKAPLPELKIVYNPQEIVSFFKKNNDSISVNDLAKGFGYEEHTALLIMFNMRFELGLVTSGEDDYKLVDLGEVEGEMQRVRVQRVYHLTKQAESIVPNLGERELLYTTFPIFSSTSAPMINELLAVCRVRGWDFDQLNEMLDNKSPELMEIMEKIKVGVVGNLSPEEIRQLGREVEEFFKDVSNR